MLPDIKLDLELGLGLGLGLRLRLGLGLKLELGLGLRLEHKLGLGLGLELGLGLGLEPGFATSIAVTHTKWIITYYQPTFFYFSHTRFYCYLLLVQFLVTNLTANITCNY